VPGSDWPPKPHDRRVTVIIPVLNESERVSSVNGLDLTRSIRKHYLLPYIYIVVLSAMSRLQEIKDGLVAGVDDYLIKPPNPLQVRSRVLVGLRWLQYIDSLYEGKA
jgi:CheY-like chemotaxis protein